MGVGRPGADDGVVVLLGMVKARRELTGLIPSGTLLAQTRPCDFVREK